LRLKLTKATVGKLAPKATHYEAYDTDLAGLVFRVQATGTRVWWFVYRHHGRLRRYKIGNYPGVSPEGARSIATQLAGQVAAGIDVQASRERDRLEAERLRASTLKAFLDLKYEPWAKSHLKTYAEQLARIRSDFAKWLDRPMGTLSRFLIESWRKQELDRGKRPRTVNRDLQRLTACLGKAVAWGVIPVHPYSGVKPLKTDDGGRVRFLAAAEEKALRAALATRELELCAARDRFNEWRAARHMKLLPRRTGAYLDHLRPMVLLALNTGLRRGELLSLHWHDINLAGKLLTIPGSTAKTGQTRRVPLNAEALEALNTWCELTAAPAGEAFVFPGENGKRMGSVSRSWKRVSAIAGLNDFRFHDLRHHFASRLVIEGVPLNTVRELLGHTSLEMTLKYSHLAPEGLASAVEKVSGAMA
jgi:integrase